MLCLFNDPRDWREGRGFIWSIWFNQTNGTDQINKIDQPVLARHVSQSVALTDFSASCQEGIPSLHDLGGAMPAIAFHAVDYGDELLRFHLAGFDGHHRVAFHAFEIDRLHAGHFRQCILDITQVGIANLAAEHEHDFLIAREDRRHHRTNESDQTTKLDICLHGLPSLLIRHKFTLTPLHRSGRAARPHPAPTCSDDAKPGHHEREIGIFLMSIPSTSLKHVLPRSARVGEAVNPPTLVTGPRNGGIIPCVLEYAGSFDKS